MLILVFCGAMVVAATAPALAQAGNAAPSAPPAVAGAPDCVPNVVRAQVQSRTEQRVSLQTQLQEQVRVQEQTQLQEQVRTRTEEHAGQAQNEPTRAQEGFVIRERAHALVHGGGAVLTAPMARAIVGASAAQANGLTDRDRLRDGTGDGIPNQVRDRIRESRPEVAGAPAEPHWTETLLLRLREWVEWLKLLVHAS